MTDIPVSLWRLTSPELQLKQFEPQMAVLFHCASGDTHLLDMFGACLVTLLQQGTMPQAELFDNVSEQLNYQLDEALQTHLETTLSSLQKLEIIELL